MEFKTEVNQLLNLMIHSLYSNKEIFLRELVSNASDAIDKLNYLYLSDDAYKNLNFTPAINIYVNKDAKTLIIEDNGIGMDKEDLHNNLGTIASSGTKKFLENISEDAKKNSDLIGQFGVGFYSAFMVASKIEVYTKKALSNEAFLWTSDASGYEINSTTKESFGTKIVLHLKDEEFANAYTIENLVSKYSNHISYPIFLEKEVSTKEDDKEVKEIKLEQINKAKALWRENKASLKEQDYFKFYESISYDSKEPLTYVHTNSEGSLNYSSLFFIPASAPFDLYRVDYEKQCKLYVKRVLISEKEELLPSYLRFVKGIIDVEDLPLNVSREILQENTILKKIKEVSTKKILSQISKLKENDKEKFKEFSNLFGAVIKEALFEHNTNKDEILSLCLFNNTKSDEALSIDELISDDNKIYYLLGENLSLLKNSPLLEKYKDKTVIFLSDKVDEIVMPNVTKYKEHDLINIKETQSGIKSDLSEEESKLKDKIKESLKDEVKDVNYAELGSSLSALSFDKNDQEYQMAKMMAQFGGQKFNAKPILEINPNHETYLALKDKFDDEKIFNDFCLIAYGLAALSQGLSFDKVSEFNKAILRMIK